MATDSIIGAQVTFTRELSNLAMINSQHYHFFPLDYVIKAEVLFIIHTFSESADTE